MAIHKQLTNDNHDTRATAHPFSARSDVAPFYAMDILARANQLLGQGAPVVSLAVGQPGAALPLSVREAASQAVMDNVMSYTDALGRMSARQAVAAHYSDIYGLDVSPSRIAMTNGSSAGFSLAFLALANAGGRIAITSPGYPAYRNIIRALSMECVEISTAGQPGHMLDLDALVAEHRKKPIDALLLASPANPTGAALNAAQLGQVIATCKQHGIRFISDEIYHRLRYEGDDICALSLDDEAIIINSFSKYYCMTGWRIGWMVVPEAMVRTIEKLGQNLYISAPDLSQRVVPSVFAATADYDVIKQGYSRNRAVLMEKLPALGFSFAAPPDGAFYAWCDVSALTNDSMDFAKRMIEEIHVAAAPGLDFDVQNGHRYMRFSYAGTPDDIDIALERLARWV